MEWNAGVRGRPADAGFTRFVGCDVGAVTPLYVSVALVLGEPRPLIATRRITCVWRRSSRRMPETGFDAGMGEIRPWKWSRGIRDRETSFSFRLLRGQTNGKVPGQPFAAPKNTTNAVAGASGMTRPWTLGKGVPPSRPGRYANELNRLAGVVRAYVEAARTGSAVTKH